MNYEEDQEAMMSTVKHDARFALEREARRFGFVGEGRTMIHPELGLRLVIRCEETD